jgi:hypothetical protein
MRIVVGWEGSGHALRALAMIAELLRPSAVEHVEIVLPVWPEVDIPRWTDIHEQQFLSDDMHQAAAQVVTDEISRLTAVLKPVAESVVARIEAGDEVELFLGAVQQSRADLVLIAAGTRDASGHIEETVTRLVRSCTVPTLVLRSPSIGAEV